MIELINCTKTYNKNSVGIKDVNIKIRNTGFVSITGTSGSGKSTFINCLGGLDSFSNGKVIIDGVEVKDLSHYSTYVFQEAKLIEDMSVSENILFSLPKNELTLNLDEILCKLKIQEIKDRPVNEVSGGQRQRVAIARAIMKDVPIIFCDEPTSSLDTNTSTEIFSVLKELSREKLVIVVTHDNEEISKFADQKIVIESNKIVSNDIINKCDDLKLNTTNDITLLNRLALKISKSNIKDNIVKTVMTIIFLFFALTAVSILFNIVTINVNKVSYDAYTKNNTEYVKFNRNIDDDIKSHGGYSIPKSIMSELDPDIISYDEINFEVTYESKKMVFRSVLIKNNDNFNKYPLNHNEIYISKDIFGDNNINLDDYIDKTLAYSNGDFTIKGFLPDSYEYAILMSKDAYDSCLENFLYHSNFWISIGESYSTYDAYNPYNETKIPNVTNGNLPSKSKDICIPYRLISDLYPNSDPLKLLGTTITINFKEASIYRIMEEANITHSENFRVVGYTENKIIFDNDDISTYFSKYGSSRISAGCESAIYYNYTLSTFNLLSSYNLFHQGELSEKIYSIYNILYSLKTILIIILSIFTIIAFFTIINNISSSILKNKKTLGILISFGIKKFSLSKIYLFENLISTLISSVLSIIAYIIIIIRLNKYFMKNYLINFPFLKIDMLVIISMIIFSILIMFIGIIIPLTKLLRKNRIDILYER